MKLAHLLQDMDYVATNAGLNVASLAFDSRYVEKGDTYIAAIGPFCDYRSFCQAAIDRGASSILYQVASFDDVTPDLSVPLIKVVDLADHVAIIAKRFYHDPSSKLQLLGITGTNGKSSIAYSVQAALNYLSVPTHFLGTLGHGNSEKAKTLNNTTPGVVELNQLLNQDVKDGIQAVAMEVSSHGLVLGRVSGLHFDIAVLTNLTRDHLDFHGSMQEYAKAKERLFQMPGLKKAVVNIDDDFGCEIRDKYQEKLNLLTYALEAQADFYVLSVTLEKAGQRARLQTPDGERVFTCPLLGRFNLANALAVVATLVQMGFSVDQSIDAVEKLPPVPGRMQTLCYDNKPLVVVDYAHTPDALEKALECVKDYAKGRVFCVVGCGGDRDKGKRPLMAQAAMTADVVIFTDDNPRTENPKHIMADMLAGIEASNATVIHARQDAIAKAIAQAKAGDVVLIAGKGHEDYQIIGDKKLAFDDVAVAKAFLEDM